MMCVNYKHIMQILPLCETDKGVCREESGSQGSNPACFETLNILSPPGSSSSPGRMAIMMSPLLFLLHVPLVENLFPARSCIRLAELWLFPGPFQ